MAIRANTYLPISSFNGINIRDSSAQIPDTELVECTNFDLNVTGELTKRTGFRQLLSTNLPAAATTLLGYYQTDTLNQVLARSGTNLYYSVDAGNIWTLIAGGPWGNVEFGVQYTNKFYLVRRDAVMLLWDGTTMTAITGSPMGSHVIAYKDRLFVINTYAAGSLSSRLYYSKVADFTVTGWLSTGFIDISTGDGDYNVVMTQLQDVLFVFKSRSTWLLYVSGDPTTWTVRNASPEIGCISRYTPKEIESYLYFVGLRGVYRTDGTTFSEISRKIQFTFLNQSASNAELNKAFAGWWQDRYIIFFSFVSQTSTWGSLTSFSWNSFGTWGSVSGSYYKSYVYHLRNSAWTQWEPASTIAPFNFVEITQPSNQRGLLSGTRNADGKVFKYGETAYIDGLASNYECRLRSKEFDYGQAFGRRHNPSPTSMKRGKLLMAKMDSKGSNSFQNIVTGTPYAVQVITGTSGGLVYKLKGPQYFRVWQLVFSATHSNPITFYGYTLWIDAKKEVSRSGV